MPHPAPSPRLRFTLQERAWDDFFLSRDGEDGGDLSVRMAMEPFMRGSFGYHFHAHAEGTSVMAGRSRYEFGLRSGSWAATLARRFEEQARAKEAVCGGST